MKAQIFKFLLNIAALVLALYFLYGMTQATYQIHTEIQQQREDTQNLIKIWQQQIKDNAEFKAEWREFMDRLQVEEMTATAYAPLDPDAVEGMCYSGNPYVTATGARTTPGRTIATDPDVIPMGARVYIPGVGVRVAEDRGPAIKGQRIDLCIGTKKAALKWGIRGVTAVWVK
ncbi:MAG: 3D domain-containing protein [Dehalococcoidales bacterium]|nr:3D domain-containing protein [Dehalococcoidales bacterium]